MERVVHSKLDFSGSSVGILIEFAVGPGDHASCELDLEPVAVEDVRVDVVAVAMGIEWRGVGARFDS